MSSRRFSRLLLLGVLTGALGCSDVCTRNSDCGDGLICGAANTCTAPPIDASTDGEPTSSDAGSDLATPSDSATTSDHD